MEYIKFLTNLPQKVTIKYNNGLEKEGKFGKQWNWGVTQDGVDKMMSVTEKLNGMLESLTPGGRTLEILKYEDGTTKLWKILENGQDITPDVKNGSTRHVSPQSSTSTSKTAQIVPQDQFLTITQFNETLDKMRKAFKEMDTLIHEVGGRNQILEEKVEKLEKELEYFSFIFKQNNPQAHLLHEKDLPESKEPEIPVLNLEDINNY